MSSSAYQAWSNRNHYQEYSEPTAKHTQITARHPNAAPNKHKSHYPQYLPLAAHDDVSDSTIPESFSWTDTVDLSPVADQGKCASCWAFATVGMLSDRTTIAQKQSTAPALSAEIVKACTMSAVGAKINKAIPSNQWNPSIGTCAVGGFIAAGCWFAEAYGVPLDGCSPYPRSTQENGTDEPCNVCEPSSQGSNSALYSFQTGSTSVVTLGPEKQTFNIDDFTCAGKGCLPTSVVQYNVKNMQKNILKYGPLAVGYVCYKDMVSSAWKDQTSPEDVYVADPSSGVDGGHAVVIVGWGVTPQNKTPYWLVRNSWGTSWNPSLSGYWRHIRGQNDSGIESSAVSAVADTGSQLALFSPKTDITYIPPPGGSSGLSPGLQRALLLGGIVAVLAFAIALIIRFT